MGRPHGLSRVPFQYPKVMAKWRDRKATEDAKPTGFNAPENQILDFPVVGIGASAGGLEALQEFFKRMPPEPGAAFVVVQHLSPDYKSLMNELLARHTSMIIHKVENGMKVEENHIYLIPPRMNMTIVQGTLFLSEHTAVRTLNLPIDIFLRSLAKDQEKNAIAIILSGTGSDGTLGIRAIKEFGGMTMVQDDRSAKFDGMPRSSISTGMVDFILPPAKLAEELVTYIKHPFVTQKSQVFTQHEINEDQLAKVIGIIKDAKGVDFSLYKDNTILRRLEKRVSINRFGTIQEYVGFLNNNLREINILFNELLIGVTRFFRDEDAFAKLRTEVLSHLIRKGKPRQEVRIWVPGCSTGEEAYSLAIMMHETISESAGYCDVKIFATDLDTESLEFAGIGLYPESIASDINPERVAKYFIRKEGGYQVNETIRSMIIFARHNLLQDPPFSKLDLISCRNLLIYLNNEAQKHVLSVFYYALAESGYLFLGTSESPGYLSEGFQTLDSKHKIYRQVKGFNPPHVQKFGMMPVHKTTAELRSLGTTLRTPRNKTFSMEGVFDEVLSEYVPPSVIVDENFEVVHTIHRVSNYLSLPVGQASLNLLKLLPRDLAVVANSLIRRLNVKNKNVVFENVTSINREKTLTLSGRKLTDAKTGLFFYLISFIERDIEKKSKRLVKTEKIDIQNQYRERIEELEKELQFKSENLQAVNEELETSNEELQSSNEELIASNEELQSTNEELQSVNEELYTVNSEHVRKIEELTEAYADMDNLLRNTRIGTLFLDRELVIRKVNDVATRLTNIMPGDVGRPIGHLSLHNIYPEFIAEITEVANTLISKATDIKDIMGHWYLMKILPYRTAENAVNGIIVLFIDVTNLKETESHVDLLTRRLERSLEMGGMSWWEWNYMENKVTTGKAKYEMLGYTAAEIGNGFEGWTNLIHPADLDQAMKAMKDHLTGKAEFYLTEYRIRKKDGTYAWFRDKGGTVRRTRDGKPEVIMGIVMNTTAEHLLEASHQRALSIVREDVEAADQKFELLFNTLTSGIVYQDADGQIVGANPAAERILGVKVMNMVNRTSASAEWKALRADGSEFRGEDHPAMVALRTGRIVQDVIMGVYNPVRKRYIWIRIKAIPLIAKGKRKPWQVYTVFDEIEHKA